MGVIADIPVITTLFMKNISSISKIPKRLTILLESNSYRTAAKIPAPQSKNKLVCMLRPAKTLV